MYRFLNNIIEIIYMYHLKYCRNVYYAFVFVLAYGN